MRVSRDVAVAERVSLELGLTRWDVEPTVGVTVMLPIPEGLDRVRVRG